MNIKVTYYFLRLRSFLVIALISVFTLSCERPVSVSPPDEPPPNGSMFIDSSPDGAKIFVNGKDRRRITPDSISWLATGDYEVTLKKEFFRDTNFIMEVTEGSRKEIFVDYFSNPSMLGSINCNSFPTAAAVMLDDIDVGMETPCVLNNVTPGYHTIKYILPEHRITEVDVIVMSSNIAIAQATLVNTTIWEEYNLSNSEIPTNNMTDILVDSRGIVWVGTFDEGLLRYEDGIWTNYRESNSNISSHQIHCLEEGPKGNIWVGTFDGVWEIELPSRFFQWNFRNSNLPDMNINDITTENQYVMWFATINGVAKLERIWSGQDGVPPNWEYTWNAVYTPFDTDLPEENITSIAIGGDDKWFGTEKRGVTTFKVAHLMTTFTRTDGMARNTVSKLIVDKNGLVWVGHNSQIQTTGGLSCYNGTRWENLSHLIHGEDVLSLFADSKNQKWVGTSRALYIILNSEVIRVFEYATTGLNLDCVEGISEDAEGFIWLATQKDGIIKVNTNKL